MSEAKKTVKVKIAVAVGTDGRYVAYSHDGKKSWLDCMELMLDEMPLGEARYWVEAELAIPDVATVQGEAIEAT